MNALVRFVLRVLFLPALLAACLVLTVLVMGHIAITGCEPEKTSA